MIMAWPAVDGLGFNAVYCKNIVNGCSALNEQQPTYAMRRVCLILAALIYYLTICQGFTTCNNT